MQNNQQQMPTRERKLDQERAQSMADEGGVSGAVVDAREQAQTLDASLARRTRWGSRKVWALAALGAGFWLVSVALRRVVSRV